MLLNTLWFTQCRKEILLTIKFVVTPIDSRMMTTTAMEGGARVPHHHRGGADARHQPGQGGPRGHSRQYQCRPHSRPAQQTQHGAAQSHTISLGPLLLPARSRHLHQKSSCAWAIKSCPHNGYVEQYCHANLYNMLQIGFSIHIPMFSCL